MLFESINPATGEVVARYDEMTPHEAEEALSGAHGAFLRWRQRTYEERAEPIRRTAQYLRNNKDRLARVVTTEMGKPITETEGEIEKCAWACEFYSEHAAEFLKDQQIHTNAQESFVVFEPLGVILAVMPWNYPIWQVFRFAIPALMAGNAAVVKHAPNVPQSALEVEKIFQQPGFPQGIVRNLFISPEAAGEMIADDRIAAITLTGSTRAGRAVAAAAGQAVKKSVLELGGSDPFIVLEDADLPGAVEFAVKSRFQNTGQSCIAAKRFLVVESIADEFEQRFAQSVANLRVGNPLDAAVNIGPLARADLRDNLERQVNKSVEMGARVLCGGESLNGPGYFYKPTVLVDVHPDMPVLQEEVFGPVAPLLRVRDEDEAIRLANDSRYGLGSELWTRDLERAKALARRIEAGSVFINGMVFSDPRLPFGGTKESGFGRELSPFGIHEFTNIQTIWVGPATDPQQPQTFAAAE